MKVAIFSESPADEAALRILVDALLGTETETVAPPRLRSRGWPSVLNMVPAVLRHMYYQTDADAMVVVVDTDSPPFHEPGHEVPGGRHDKCRLCQVRARVEDTRTTLKPVAGRSVLKTAIGVATLSMEAWYRCGLEAHVGEAAWAQESTQASGLRHRRLELKRKVYGTDRPSLELARRRAVEEARRLAQDLALLKKHFPNGFGPLARDVSGWKPGSGPDAE